MIRFPDWARNDAQSRLKFLCGYAALQAGPGGISGLAEVTGVSAPTFYNGIDRGCFSTKISQQICQPLAACGLKFHWFVAPMYIELDADGVVTNG